MTRSKRGRRSAVATAAHIDATPVALAARAEKNGAPAVTNSPLRRDIPEDMNATVNDSELLMRYRFKKSEPSFQILVERYQSMVLGTAFRRTGNLETASDVAQRVFAVLARK